MMILIQDRLQCDGILEYGLVIAEHVRRSIYQYSKHLYLVMKGLKYLHTFLHDKEICSKITCLKSCLPIAIPMDWRLIDKYKQPCLAAPGGLVPCKVIIDKYRNIDFVSP